MHSRFALPPLDGEIEYLVQLKIVNRVKNGNKKKVEKKKINKTITKMKEEKKRSKIVKNNPNPSIPQSPNPKDRGLDFCQITLILKTK